MISQLAQVIPVGMIQYCGATKFLVCNLETGHILFEDDSTGEVNTLEVSYPNGDGTSRVGGLVLEAPKPITSSGSKLNFRGEVGLSAVRELKEADKVQGWFYDNNKYYYLTESEIATADDNGNLVSVRGYSIDVTTETDDDYEAEYAEDEFEEDCEE